MKRLDRRQLTISALSQRQSKTGLDSVLDPLAAPGTLLPEMEKKVGALAQKIKRAKDRGAPVVMAFGAHLIKNGLGLVLSRLLEKGWIDHLSTNGAGTIHDWELAFQGRTEEDVRRYLAEGRFGIWEETGRYLNLAIVLGACKGLGYGASIGCMIDEERLVVPEKDELLEDIAAGPNKKDQQGQWSAKAACLEIIEQFDLKPGEIKIPHPFKESSYQYHAHRLGKPLSVCPGIGYDIIYTHPLNHGASIGQAALWDFLEWAEVLSRIEGGVFLSVGSAIMAPQITEKALSMAQNLALQKGRNLSDFDISVVDIQPGEWDWSKGEPGKDHPAYYLRFCKSFSRLGGRFEYLRMDNVLFMTHLLHLLEA